ncbi:MAG: tRNA (adenosine(37)-N6)-dimethylallyltransferase MiaA [Ignavibacteria bacterium]|nr:tRNA (adenosine(37)-N6)-dimethylallyltransferase MiaA [Ignavibacteria bacterium]
MKYDLITILGCTATGKTKLAVQLADYFNGEIISADSRQVYRGMNIGTGKDLSEYSFAGKQIPFYLIDIIDPTEEFNLYSFQQLFYKSFNDILNRKKLPFLVGGTGLYLSSVLQNYNLSKADFETQKQSLSVLTDDELREILKDLNPTLHNTTDLNDRERIIKAIAVTKSQQENFSSHFEPDLACRQTGSSGEKSATNYNRDFSACLPGRKVVPLLRNDRKGKISSLTIGVNLAREEIKKRITQRLKKRLDEGMIEEVKSLMDSGVDYDKMIFFGLEYKFIAQYLNGKLNRNDMFQKLNSAIHAFAKRQMTWFRKMEKEGIIINWIDGPDFNKAKELIEQNI